MGFCYELGAGPCGCPVRTKVCTALCHFMVHGILIVSFVFTNQCYPPLYYVDYWCGGSGGALLLISFLTACVVDLKKFQFIRGFCAFILILAVLSTITSTFYYVIARWNDVEVTALTAAIRKPPLTDFPDELWYTISVMSCMVTPMFLYYCIYILSFMCNKWKSHLFTTPYYNDVASSPLMPPITVPADRYSTKSYKPYPIQKTEHS